MRKQSEQRTLCAFNEPGGAILSFEGDLYRPAQDSRVRYGMDLRMFRIDTLTPDRYRETEVGPVAPHWKAQTVGLHHVSMSETVVVVDAVTRGEDQETLEKRLGS